MHFDFFCGTSFVGKDMRPEHIEPTIRKEYIIHYILSGKGYIISDGKRFELERGHSFVVYPGRVVGYGPDDEEPWSYVWAGINSPLAGSVFQQFSYIYEDFICDKLPAEVVMPFFENVFEIGNFTDNKTRNALVYALLMRYYEKLPKCQVSREKDMVLNITDWIFDNFNTNKCTPSFLMKEFNISNSSLYRLYKNNFGMSPEQYIQIYRIEQAKNMLKNNISIKETAYLCGFSDVMYFSRVFKKIVGVPPSSYKGI